MLIKLVAVIFSQYIHILNYYTVPLKLISQLYFNKKQVFILLTETVIIAQVIVQRAA